MSKSYLIPQPILNEYIQALWSVQDNFNSPSMDQFKQRHPKEYLTISAMHRKRAQLKKDIKAMFSYSPRIAWFTLTFDNEKDKNKETTKRKESFAFLKSIFKMFVLVEEHGEDHGRYHIHGFGAFLPNKSYTDFYKWHSLEDVKMLTNENVEKKIKYLTSYATKNVPRLRRNRTLNAYRKRVDKIEDPLFKKNFPSLYKSRLATEAFLIDLEE